MYTSLRNVIHPTKPADPQKCKKKSPSNEKDCERFLK